MTNAYVLMTRPQTRHRPNFILLGQGKAGTSLIFRYLKAQPDVTVSTRKELHFFSNHFHKGLDWYETHFPDPDGTRITAEVSPSYLSPRAIQRIATNLGTGIQLAFVLRGPLEHCYSRYVQNLCARQSQDTLPDKLDALSSRLRVIEQAITLCYRLFGAERILPLFYETDIAGPRPRFAQKLARFLGFEAAPSETCFPIVNQGVMPWLAYVQQDTVIWQDRARYMIPKNHLVFCAQPRNSVILSEPSQEQLTRSFNAAATWCKKLSARDYAYYQNRVIIPAAKRLEQDFGFDMTHWCNPAYEIRYPPAPLPAGLKVDED